MSSSNNESAALTTLIRVCGLATGLTGAVVLLGWLAGFRPLTTFWTATIPMAPSTALLFVLFGIGVLVSDPARTRGKGLRFCAGVVTCIALTLVVTSARGIYIDVEHLWFDVTGAMGAVPFGHMSPLTALCFTLAGAAFVAARAGSETRAGGIAAFLLSFAVVLVSLVLTTAYMLGGPLLYDSGVIPPALPTSLAFLTLGIASAGSSVARIRSIGRRADPSDGKATITLLLIFVLAATGIVAAGYVYFRNYRKRFRSEMEAQLAAMAAWKIDSLSQWRRERLGDASMFVGNENFSGLLRRYLDSPDDTDARCRLRTWMLNLRTAYGYDGVFIADTDGVCRESYPDAARPDARYPVHEIREVLHTGQPRFVDFRRDAPTRPIYLDILAPIAENGRALAVLVLRIDPETNVYPLLSAWPTPSRTAETLLVRRDGEHVLFLNKLRFNDTAALNLRLPLNTPNLPAAMAARGTEGIVDGIDYRGVPVVAALVPVPDAPWFLVARMDAAEVYAPARERLWTIVAFVGVLLLGASVGVGALWRQQRVRFYRERYDAARALARSEDTLRTIFENTRDGILVADAVTRRFVNANRAICLMTGYTHDEMLQLGLNDLHPAESIPHAVDQFERHSRGENVLAVDIPVRRKDGSEFFVEINSTPLKLDGKDCLIGVFRDITERKRAEEKLRYHEMLLKEMGRIAQIGGWEFDPATGRGTWTEEVARIHGLDDNSETSMEMGLSFYRAESRDRIERAVKKAIETGEPYDLELELDSADGAHKWIRTIGNPIVENGKVVRVRGSFQDITEQKRTEAHIRHLNAVLRGIRNVNQLITREKDRQKLIRQACDMLVEARGFHSVVVGLTDAQNARVVAYAGAGREFEALEDVLRRGELPCCARRAGERGGIAVADDDLCAGCSGDGAIGGHDALAITLAHDGRVHGFLLAYLDGGMADDPEEQDLLREMAGDIAFALHGMTVEAERDKSAAALADTEEQLRQAQKLEAVGRLAGGVAHDFNNILMAQLCYCDLIRKKLNPADPLAKDVDQIEKCGRRAATLTSQLLAFSRKQTLQPEVLNLNEVVTEIEKMLRRLIGEDIDFTTVLSENLGTVKADRGQIEQVIMNLAVNARDAMPEGGRLSIETANIELDENYARKHVGTEAGPHVMLAITDTGTGMDEATKSRLFEPFFTTKERGKGTGLGLATVYGIVKQSGGNIWVYSEPGGGSTFKVYLPRIEDKTAARPKTEPAKDARGGGETILVVEDEPVLRELLSRMVEGLGYRVSEAANGGEALLAVEESGLRPDLMITDVVMPGMGGRVLTERLRRIQPGLRVLYTSGYTDNAIVHHGVLDPGTPFLQKPFRIGDLAAKIRELLDAR